MCLLREGLSLALEKVLSPPASVFFFSILEYLSLQSKLIPT